MTDSLLTSQSPCPVEQNEDLQRYFMKAGQTRTPLSASFALTHRCTFRCRHCYLGNQDAISTHRSQELDTTNILRLLNEMATEGTLFLTLTGGDPMIRPDFATIYEHAVRLGLLVTVFCNGSLITESIVRLFQTYPPRKIEVSVYGVTEHTYATVTGTANGLTHFRDGINRLRDAGIRYTLKTMVMTLNVHEFSAMRDMAAERGVHFRHDTAVTPCSKHHDNHGIANSDENEHPLSHPITFRLPPEEAARIDGSAAELRAVLKTCAEDDGDTVYDNRLYQCGAGLSLFHIDPYGWMQPCLVTTRGRFDLKRGSFVEGWNGSIKEFTEQVAGTKYPCTQCQDLLLCSGCPASFGLETGEQEQPAPFYCYHAAARRKIGLNL